MKEVQRFVLENIYCAPSEDKQFRFTLVRVTSPDRPSVRTVRVYNDYRPLPHVNTKFHVYVLGALPNKFLGLVGKDNEWVRGKWINVEEDMNLRNYIFQLYTIKGVMFPRKHIYYQYVPGNGLIIAVEDLPDFSLRGMFSYNELKYLRVYSNNFTSGFRTTGSNPSIKVESGWVYNNLQKVAFQTKINNLRNQSGDVLIYVNGEYTRDLKLSIPDQSFIEILYDASIMYTKVFKLSDLRAFNSELDGRVKYFIYNEEREDFIVYEDDLEIYAYGNYTGSLSRGVYYYQHKHYSLTNVSDKDYAIDSMFLNNHFNDLEEITKTTISDKYIILYYRDSPRHKKLIYSALKLHELYKLPNETCYDVMSNHNYSITDFRVEHLEKSAYFKVAGLTDIRNLTPALATSAVGYNGLSYYYGNTPNKPDSVKNVEVPPLYRYKSFAYEYSMSGKMIGFYPTYGPMYSCHHQNCFDVEFLQGDTVPIIQYHLPNEPIQLRDGEPIVLSAYFQGPDRITDWTDITESEKVSIVGNVMTVDEGPNFKIRLVYLNENIIQDYQIPFYSGVLMVQINGEQDRNDGQGVRNYAYDIPRDTIEVFLNGHRLVYGLDFRLDFPSISITNKSYVNYDSPTQHVHVRMSGRVCLDVTEINQREITGYVNNGVLTRNNYYDIRDDKVFSIYVDGKLMDRESVRFSEEDNTVRLEDPLNGKPYSIVEKYLSLKQITGLNTEPYYKENMALNERISNLYNVVYPEPPLDDFNLIEDHHYLFSPVISKLIEDLLNGSISPAIYTNPYNDNTIRDLFNTQYKLLYKLDPSNKDYPNNIVEIHPHYGNDLIEVNAFQYRFIQNAINVLTEGKPERINLSGYLTLNRELGETMASEWNIQPPTIVRL